MRTLNKRQKKILINWFNENCIEAGSIHGDIDIPLELFDELIKINDHETIHQNIEKFVSDMVTEKVCAKADRVSLLDEIKKNPAKYIGSQKMMRVYEDLLSDG